MGARSRSVSVASALLLFVAACGTDAKVTPSASPSASPTASPTLAPSPTATPTDFDAIKAMDHVRALSAEIGIRMSGTPGDEKAAKYIERELGELGWHHELQPFPLPQGGTSWNVIGRPESFDPRYAKYLIVGGHFDSLNGPGANDNGTGIGIALEIARRVSVDPAPLPVMVVAFGAEERQPTPKVNHHVGSQYFVPHMTAEEKRNLVAFINIDMVGIGSPIICGRMSVGPREGTDRCLSKAAELDIPAKLRVTPDWSDNGTFLKAGLNAAWLWTGDDPCCYHSPKDRYERVRIDDVGRAGDLALAMVRSYSR
jgi:aminopeptidase YwaD